MAAKSYEVPDPQQNPEAYLSYSVQDAPNVSYEAWLHSRGKSYTWLRRNGLASPGYKNWKERTLQNYDNYLNAYKQNFDSELARRYRLEQAGFSGQYLANGIGGGSAGTAGASLNSGLFSDSSHVSGVDKGLNKVMQSLELMSAAGIAMKNFGEGKAAMKYATSISGGKAGLLGNQSRYYSNKADEVWQDYTRKAMENSSFADLGVDYNQDTGLFYIKDPDKQTPNLQKFVTKLNSDDYKIFLYQQQYELNKLTYQNRLAYEGEIMRLQKELLEGKKSLQDVEIEYASWVKKAGLGYPILKMGLESLKLFM